ncbi:hypothetical protein [Alishewanella tabrizica]|uniref:Lipase n=1 Tax=Alishewanella tabrizica TaxID=671278 RepID=A0ABQ2WJ51_9ALTE|nr:hypothetical protein [Alishewanella tabrizica]GGW59120.1 hypothetical protein GCM10008111_14010 [Alishewanella tabrizica]
MKILRRLCGAAFISALLSVTAHAAVGGYPVVLVHGFQPDNLASRPNASQVTQNGAAYWSEFWGTRAEVRIDWPSHERITGQIATQYVWPKLRQMSINNTCNPGCVFVTHSTGDLVTRYILDNQALWLQNAGLRPLNIVATFDFAGAGGGSELADLAVNVATGGGLFDRTLQLALSLWLGQLPNANNVGVLNDLRVNTARQLAAFPDSRVPRLRFVGAGSDFLGATGAFLPGTDDGVVASHSSCGASRASSFDSCATNVAFDGKLVSQSSGVTSFMPLHFPMLMSEAYSHNQVIGQQRQGNITVARNSARYTDQKLLSFSSYDETRGWLFFASRYRVVSGSERQAMSPLVFQAAN